MKRSIWIVMIFVAVAALLFATDALTIRPDGTIAVYIHGSERRLDTVVPPVGAIEAYALSTEPVGWLICDGRAIDKAADPEYTTLVDALRAEAAGNPNHPYYHTDPNKAHIPDLRGRFVRGLDTSGETPPRDPGAVAPVGNTDDRRVNREGTEVGVVLGSIQEDAFQGHWHQLTMADGTTLLKRTRQGTDTVNNSLTDAVDSPQTDWLAATPVADGTNGTPRTSAETRPENIAVNYIIKY